MNLPEKMRGLSDEQWLSLLIKSISTPTIDGVEFPRFPDPTVQTNFVGSSDETTLRGAFSFYSFVKRQAKDAGRPLQEHHRFLDFGCGWGRYLRFFWKDIAEDNLYGCDVGPPILEVCRETKVPGKLSLIKTDGALPYPDGYFNVIMAYSVFTHLPESMNLHWMKELARVAAPGCIFCLTLEPRRFIDLIVEAGQEQPAQPTLTQRFFNLISGSQKQEQPARLKSLSRFKGSEAYKQFDAGEIAFFPTGSETGILNSSVYGDAVVPLSFIEKNWAPYFEVKEYIDDKDQFCQAVLALQRTQVK